jgi:hypothetical protein
MIIGGSKRSIIYDDVSEEKIKIYNSGVLIEKNLQNEAYEYLVKYNLGDIEIPKLPKKYPLNNTINHFRECVEKNKMPLSSKKSIINVTEALEIISKV